MNYLEITGVVAAPRLYVDGTDPATGQTVKTTIYSGYVQLTANSNPGMVTFGAIGETVAIAPDPRGGEHQWLQISFQTPVYAHKLVELNHRVTVRR